MDSIKCGRSPNSKKIVIILHVPIVWTYSGVIIPNLKVIAFTRQLMTRGPFQTRNKMKFLNNFKQFMISLTNFTLFCGAILNLNLDSSILDVFSAYSQVRTNLKCPKFPKIDQKALNKAKNAQKSTKKALNKAKNVFFVPFWQGCQIPVGLTLFKIYPFDSLTSNTYVDLNLESLLIFVKNQCFSRFFQFLGYPKSNLKCHIIF